MQLDECLLEETRDMDATLHIFQWPEPSVSLGCLMKESTLLSPSCPLPCVRRPTGGGLMLHGFDLCFSIIVGPNHRLYALSSLDAYHWVHERTRQALEMQFPSLKNRLGWIEKTDIAPNHRASCCLMHPSIYDLTLDASKIMGVAARRKKSLLHQCSLHLMPPPEELIKKVFVDASTYATMIASQSTGLSLALDKHLEVESVQHALIETFSQQL